MHTLIQRIVLIPLFLVLILPAAHPLRGQTNFAATWFLFKDDNAFKSRVPYDEWINTFSLYAGQTFSRESAMFRVYYNGDFSKYSNYTDRQNNSHQLGIALNYSLKSTTSAMMGAYGMLRRNESQYIYYNVNRYMFYGNLRYEPDISKVFTAGILYGKNDFREFREINNIEYKIFARYQQFFRNRMSFSGEIGMGVKNYVNQSRQVFFGQAPFRPLRQQYVEEEVSATMLSLGLNIARSLTNKTGLSINFGGQRYAGDPIETYSDQVYYYTENDLYDDPYGYENNYVSLALTRQFGVGFQGKLGVEYQDKDYRGTEALTMDGNLQGTHRQDERRDYFLIITKTFQTGWRFPTAVDAFFRFNIRNNSSNDPYYHYQDHLGILGITISK